MLKKNILNLPLILHLPNGHQRSVNLPANFIIRRLIPALTSKLDLPTHDSNGNPLVYSLHFDVNGEALPDDIVLENAGNKIPLPPHTHLHILATSISPPKPSTDSSKIILGKTIPVSSPTPSPSKVVLDKRSRPTANNRGRLIIRYALVYLMIVLCCRFFLFLERDILVNQLSSPSPTIESNITNGGLIAYYPFNKNANDESGSENHGLISGVTPITDRFGNIDGAYKFDGLDDSISMLSNVSRHAEFSQSLWIWVASDNPNAEFRNLVQTANGGIHSSGSISTIFLIDIYANRDGGLTGPGSATRYYYKFNVDGLTRNWNHIVFVAYANDTAKFFINGEEISIGMRITDGGVTGNYEATVIGATQDSRYGTTYHYFDGLIDDVRFYDHALTKRDIQMLFAKK